MRVKFDFKRCKWIADTDGQDINVHLRECYSIRDIIEALDHEVKHAMINKFKGNTTAVQDHWLIKRFDVDQI